MASYDFDLFTIGAGSGGVRASRMSASHGARVAVAEERELGGTCVNVGCIPKKLLVYASAFGGDFEDAGAYGWRLGARSHDWPTLVANKDQEIARLNGVYAGLLDAAGVTRIEGRAREGTRSMSVLYEQFLARLRAELPMARITASPNVRGTQFELALTLFGGSESEAAELDMNEEDS